MNKTWYLVNIIVLFSLVIVPMGVLASIPTTTSFDRHNEYVMDGYRDGGYYAVRQNPAITGYMNMSHIGGTNEFTIETYNIENITLDLELMYENRRHLFNWTTVSYEDMIASLDGQIIIHVNSSDGINELRFVDHDGVACQVYRDGEIYQPFVELADVKVETNPIGSGYTQVILEFDGIESTYDILSMLLQIAIIFGMLILVGRYLQKALFFDGSYYEKWGGGEF